MKKTTGSTARKAVKKVPAQPARSGDGNGNDCGQACKRGECDCGKQARAIDVKKIVDKAKEFVKKVPPFIKRMKDELEKLLALIAKAEAALQTLEVFTARDSASRHRKALLQKQVRGMKAYAAALGERIAEAEKEAGLK